MSHDVRQNDSLDEEFYTQKYHILAPLRGQAEAYSVETGEMVRTLDSEDRLVYVTEVTDGIVTEYIDSHGQRYGLLLNDNLETLARLPKLCDILPDETLIFDDNLGHLHQSAIYSTQQLVDMAS